MLLSSAPVWAADPKNQEVLLSADKEIFGNSQAADLVGQARSHDPMFCPKEQADRDKAVQLYQQAITAQPGAKLNAALADRIAQLYAFYEDKDKKIKPDRSQASQWWGQCLTLTNPKQLLWSQAQMGLASMSVIGKDKQSALDKYNKILDVDISQVELPDWKLWPDGNTDRGKAVLEQERANLRKSFEDIKSSAVETQFYVLCHIDRAIAYQALQNMAAKYRGTPAGDRALAMMSDIRKKSSSDPWALPDLAFEDNGGENQKAMAALKYKSTVISPRHSPAATTPDENSFVISVAVVATLMSAALVTWLLRTRRGRRVR